LWIHYPFQSRNIPLFRRILPVSILLGMKAASRTSPLDLFLALIQLGIKKRLPICGIIFALLRWSIVAAIIYFVFVLNPSRTAQLSLLLVIISGIIMWNRRKGIIVTIIVTACILPIAMTNKTFVHKWQRTYTAVADFVKQDANAVKISHKDRHWILAKIIPEIKKKPIAGHGLDLNFKTVQSILEFSPNRGFIHTHCEFTQIAIQNGLAGMGFFIIFLLMTFVYSAKITSPINRFAVSIMLIVFIDLLFNVPLYFGRQKILTIFVIAAVISEISFYLQYKTNLKFRNIRKITNE
jgi:hypothetical protein